MPWFPPAEPATVPPVAHTPDSLGIIAGNRSLPRVLAREARAAGVQRLVAAAFEKETDPALEELVDATEWMRVGQLSKLIEAFQKHGITECVMVGQIAPKNLFDLRPDFRAVKLLASLDEKNAHSIFGGIADELAKEGITLIEATPWLRPAMPAAGFRLGPEPDTALSEDIAYGQRIAKEISRLDIGQTVVVKNRAPLALEAIEGTDECIRRAGRLCRSGGMTVVKVAKPQQDERFDMPTIGIGTLQSIRASGGKVLVIEAGKTILVDREQITAYASRCGISIVSCYDVAGIPLLEKPRYDVA